jgi:hypothetical protein
MAGNFAAQNRRFKMSKKTKKTKSKTSNYRLYEKAPKGFLSRCYSNMRQRVSGEQNQDRPHIYKNKKLQLMSKKEFMAWAATSMVFWTLYAEYSLNGFQRRMAPSPDRLDSNKGYTIDNLQWVPFHENARRASQSKKKKSK